MIAHHFGLHVFVCGGIFHHGADVHAAFVSEGAGADVGLIAAQRQVGQFRNEASDAGELL